jgi:ATP-dependent DNA helicase RecG
MLEHESRPRNPLIAKVFYLLGFIENWGSGYEKIRTSFEHAHLQVPTFEQVRGGIMATIQREVFQQVQGGQIYLESTAQKTTKKTTEKVLDILRSNPFLTNKVMAEMLGLTDDWIYYQIKKLKTQGNIRRVGGDNGGHWEIIK